MGDFHSQSNLSKKNVEDLNRRLIYVRGESAVNQVNLTQVAERAPEQFKEMGEQNKLGGRD